MALTRSTYTPSVSNDRGAVNTVFTSSSYTFPANSLVCVHVHGITENDTNVRPSGFVLTKSAGTDTLHDVVQTGNPVQWGFGARVWYFQTGGSSVTCTFSVQYDTGVNRNINTWVIDPVSWTGYDTTTPISGTATGTDADGTGAATITLSAAPLNGDQTVGVLSAVVNSGNCNSTGFVNAAAGWSQLNFSLDSGWGYYESMVRASSTSTSVGWSSVGPGTTSPLEAMLCAYVVNKAPAGSNFSVSTTESLTAADSSSNTFSAKSTAAESGTAADSPDASGGNSVGTAETLASGESSSVAMSAQVARTESGTAADAPSAFSALAVAAAEAASAADTNSLPSPGTWTLVWAANSIGSGWNTETGSATFTCLAGDAILVYNNGVSNTDQGTVSDSVSGTIARYTPAFNASVGSGTTYGGFSYVENVSAGSHTITPPTVVGGDDGIIRVWRLRGFGSTLSIRTAGKLRNISSSQSITCTTTGNVSAGDVAFGGRCHENSVGFTDTIGMPSGWTRECTDYTNGAVNIPTNVCSITAASGGSALSATWTSADTHITDTSAAIIVITPPVSSNSYSVSTSESGTAADASSNRMSASSSAVETAASADAVTNQLTTGASSAESGALSDSMASSSVAAGSVGEAGALADSSSLSGSGSSAATVETGALSDTTGNSAVRVAATTESGAASDASDRISGTIMSVTEAIAGLETSQATFQGLAAVSEALLGSDSSSSIFFGVTGVIETIAASDTVFQGSVQNASRTDALTALDSVDALKVITALTLEALTLADFESAVASFLTGSSDSLASVELVSLAGTSIALCAEIGVLVDQVGAGGAQGVGVLEQLTAAEVSVLLAQLYSELRKYEFAQDSRQYAYAGDTRDYAFATETRTYAFAGDPNRTYIFAGNE